MRLMMSTQLANRINIELNDTNDALTIFAPTDSAFSALSPGTINGLNDQEKTNLVLFHIVPQYIPPTQFQTVTNPLRTQAGDVGPYDYPLNVTTSPNNTVTVPATRFTREKKCSISSAKPSSKTPSNHASQSISSKTHLSKPSPKQTHQPILSNTSQTPAISPQKGALSAAKKVHDKIPLNPDSILTGLKNHGFSKAHIQDLVSKSPEILFIGIESNFIPNMEFFKATGLPGLVIAEYLSSNLVILSYSLDNRIKLVFDLIRSISSTHEVFVKMPRHSNCLFRYG
ncbi:fasciclin-like arabinogalactan protein 12 [Cinnamomum micranthum f. kanehirae]|uniref:Fasciclin-like arabinogalactan protein 12 n=1 Tax=Cinnamomum micranthum f. kanehirae TaxID=337451 RepID=A0A443PRC1_9MAGN|nr:fasciclin-like arabinogalactan protein 12 [Cinnamomum micranthum f. kanehirae]